MPLWLKPALDGQTGLAGGLKLGSIWVRFFGHLCTFIGFFAEKLGSFRNFTTRGKPVAYLDEACPPYF